MEEYTNSIIIIVYLQAIRGIVDEFVTKKQYLQQILLSNYYIA